ncbi:MAG: hypothetical protein AAGJ93_07355, partial [Bacteroidota bacterium]
DFVVNYSGAGATIKSLWTNFDENPVTVTKDEKLFTLVFRAKNNRSTLTDLISFGGNGEFLDIIIGSSDKLNDISLQVDFQKVNVKDFIIKEAYGNPFTATGNLHIKLDMKEEKEVLIQLQDEYGHVVMLDYDNLLIGENTIEIPSYTVSVLQNGKIYYTIATDEHIQSGALIKLQ